MPGTCTASPAVVFTRTPWGGCPKQVLLSHVRWGTLPFVLPCSSARRVALSELVVTLALASRTMTITSQMLSHYLLSDHRARLAEQACRLDTQCVWRLGRFSPQKRAECLGGRAWGSLQDGDAWRLLTFSVSASCPALLFFLQAYSQLTPYPGSTFLP